MRTADVMDAENICAGYRARLRLPVKLSLVGVKIQPGESPLKGEGLPELLRMVARCDVVTLAIQKPFSDGDRGVGRNLTPRTTARMARGS